jgi:hypothetical protein
MKVLNEEQKKAIEEGENPYAKMNLEKPFK